MAAPEPGDASGNLMHGYAAALGAVLLWAGFVLVSRMGGRSALTGWDIVALRMSVAALVLLPFSLQLPGRTWRDPRLWTLALVGGLASQIFVYCGFKYAPAAHGGILFSGTQPFLIPLLGWLLVGTRPDRARLLALVPIAAGVLCLALPLVKAGEEHASVLFGDVLLLGSGIAWACYSVLARAWGFDVWLLTRFMAIAGCAAYLPIYLAFLPKGIESAPGSAIVLQGLYQGIGASVVAMALFLRAVALIGPERTGVMTTFVPVLSGLAAVPLLDEPLTPSLVAGLVLVSAGAFLAARPMQPTSPSSPGA
jgi:drug/metabolite transporter (DMT)-like permease